MTIRVRQFWEELLPWEPTQWHWSKHVKFRQSEIKTVPQRLCFCAHLSNCNLVTCWRIELSILGLPHLSITINLSNSFSCSIKFFHLVSSVYICLFPWESFSRHTVFSPYVAKLNKSVWSETRMLSAIGYIQTVVWQFFCANFGRSFCRGNEHNGIDPNMSNPGHHQSRLFHKGCVSVRTCQTAILSHVGAINSAYWAFSTFQSALTWAIALNLVVLSSFFIWCPVSTFACFRGRAFLSTPYSSPYVAKLKKSVWSETRMLSAIG